MKKVFVLCLCSILLMACHKTLSQQESRHQHTIIDWVDFLKIDGIQYESIQSGVMTSSDDIGEVVGEITYKVSGNVTNPYYNIQNGDAAFWEPGTKVYGIKGAEGLVAVEDQHEVNGYRIYASETGTEQYEWHFLDIDKTAINKVEIYEGYDDSNVINTITDEQEINEFLNILNEGEERPLFTPNTIQGDPTIFEMIFYHDHVFAYKYTMLFDGDDWYWHPWETSIVSKDIGKFVEINHR